MSYKGIDVSEHNGNINWQKVRASGIDFAIIRIGYGWNTLDVKAIKNIEECIKIGMPFGIYMYSYALNTEQAKIEGDFVVEKLKPYKDKVTYPVVIDMEDADGYKKKYSMPSNDTLVNICVTECEIFKNAGYKPMIYASKSWFDGKLKSSKINKYEKWLAWWYSGAKFDTTEYPIWQNTSDGYVDGIGGRVDMNVSYKNYAGIQESSKPKSTAVEHDYTGVITYQAYANKWLPEVSKVDNTANGFAGIGSETISGFRCKPQYGEIIFEAHIKGQPNNKWLGAVSSKDYKTNDTKNPNSYAGLYGKAIDGIRVKATKGYIDYRVKTKEDGWLSWARGFGDSGNKFAGIYGHTIIGIQMK